MGAEPQHLSEAISRLIALRGLARERGDAQLKSVWQDVAGARIAKHTRPLRISRGVLHVAVSNAATLSELVSFHHGSLLRTLQQEHGDLEISDLKFRLKGDMAAQ